MANKVLGWDLWSTLIQQSAYIEHYSSIQPMACPNDGEPLRVSPNGKHSQLFCPFDGWRYPQDWDSEIHSGM